MVTGLMDGNTLLDGGNDSYLNIRIFLRLRNLIYIQEYPITINYQIGDTNFYYRIFKEQFTLNVSNSC